MAKTETIRARVEPELKAGAEAVLESLGITMTDLVTMMLRRLVAERGLPFSTRVPNAETEAALKRVQARKGLIAYDTFANLMKEVDDEIVTEDRRAIQTRPKTSPT